MSEPNQETTLTYFRPPVTEVAVEIRLSNPLSVKDIEKIAKKLKKNYPNVQPLNEVGINIGPNQVASVSEIQNAFRLTSDDQADIVIVMPHSLVIARLAPYPGWESFLSKVIAAWKIWKDIGKIRQIFRVGLRYINRIDIKLDGADKVEIEEYLNFYPKEPSLGDEPLSRYLVQITKPTHNPLWSTNITSANQPSPLINHVSLLLDIDLFRNSNISLNDDEFLAMLNEARNIKNIIFKKCITSKAESLFK